MGGSAGSDELATAVSRYSSRGGDRAVSSEIKSRQDYTDSGFWQARFEGSDGTFDWYATFSELRGIFQDYCPPTPGLQALMVGCGNSTLSAEMQQAGYQRIVNIDIAPAAVEKMEQMFGHLGLEWRVMDATAMSFDSDSFDLAVDKGTADAMLHGRSAGTCDEAAAMSAEIFRVLRPGGLFVLVSHNSGRQALLDAGVREAHGADAAWELVELRKCALSPQATFINVLRAKRPGRPLQEALKDPVLLKEAAEEARAELKKMAFLEAFRQFRARKLRAATAGADGAAAGTKPSGGAAAAAFAAVAAAAAATGAGAAAGATARAAAAGGGEAATEEDEGDEADPRPKDAWRQPYCWAYVLRKPAGPGPGPGSGPAPTGVAADAA